MAWVEIPAPADVVIDRAGNVRDGVAVTAKLAGTQTHVTHASDTNGSNQTTAGLVVRSDGSVGTATERRYVQSEQALDVSANGTTRLVQVLAAASLAGTSLAYEGIISGVDRTGVTDVASAVQTQLTAGAGARRTFPFGTYRFLSALTIPAAGLTVVLDDAVLDFVGLAASATAITAAGSLGSSVSVNAVAAGASAITGSAGIETGIVAGDVVKLSSADVFDPGRTSSTHGEQCVVLSTSPGQINLRSPVLGVYSTTVKIAKVTRPPLVLKGSGQIKCGGASSGHLGLVAKWIKNLRIDGKIEFVGCEGKAIQLWDCIDFEIAHCDIEGSNLAANGYGISVVNACQFGRVHHCHFRDCRHATSTNNSATDNGGIPRHISFESNEVRDTIATGDAMDCHAAAEHITFFDNDIFDPGNVGINIECNKAKVLYNRIYRPQDIGIYLLACAAQAPEYRAVGNEVYDSPSYGLRFGTIAGAGASTPTVLDILENHAVRCAFAGVFVDPTASTWRLVGAKVNRNRAYACNSAGTGNSAIWVSTADASEVCDNMAIEQPAGVVGTRVNDFQRGKWCGNITSFATAGTNKGHYGQAVLDSIITDNVARNATGAGCEGLELDAASANCIVGWNGLRGATTPLQLNGVTSHITTTADAGGAYNKVA